MARHHGGAKVLAALTLATLLVACTHERESESVVSLTAPRLDRAGLKPTFADEFTSFSWDEPYYKAGPNKGTWRTSYMNGTFPDEIDNRTLPGNGEMQAYFDRSFPSDAPLGLHPFEILDGGVLRITANRATDAQRRAGYDRPYTSGAIATWGSFAQRYGVFEIRARVPKGKALWPAFWLLNQKGGWPPEIDVFEILGQTTSTMHTGVKGKRRYEGVTVQGPDFAEDFHVFTVDWGPKETVLYIDDMETSRTPTPRDISKPMFMIVNLAVGGEWPGAPDETTPFPAAFDVDWVRVWQRADYEK